MCSTTGRLLAACFTGILLFVLAVLPIKGNCPTDWKCKEAECFCIVQSHLSYADAREFCSMYQGDLATPRFNGENDAIKERQKSSDTNEVAWIGIYYSGYADDWRLVDDVTNTEILPFTKWEVPVYGPDADSRLAMNEAGKWEAFNKDDELYFLCQVNEDIVNTAGFTAPTSTSTSSTSSTSSTTTTTSTEVCQKAVIDDHKYRRINLSFHRLRRTTYFYFSILLKVIITVYLFN